jgi:hypothetical protein
MLHIIVGFRLYVHVTWFVVDRSSPCTTDRHTERTLRDLEAKGLAEIEKLGGNEMLAGLFKKLSGIYSASGGGSSSSSSSSSGGGGGGGGGGGDGNGGGAAAAAGVSGE